MARSRSPSFRCMRYTASMQDVPVVLVGFMGCGKTTVGQLLAGQLGWAFHDLDEHIEARAGRSIAAIFASEGEARFRQQERDALQAAVRAATAVPQQVIALGGGAFVQPDNLRFLQQSPVLSVFLEVSFEELYRRCAGVSSRPLFQNEQAFRELYEERLPVYRQALLTVDAASSPPQVVDRILALLPFRPVPVGDR